MSLVDTGKGPGRLWLAVSGHGHGHLVQLIPLVRVLRARYPSLVLSVQSSLPANLLRQSFGADAEVHAEAADFGMVMSGPMKVLPADSLAAYREIHDNWSEHFSTQLRLFHDFRPDLVIGDIPYLPLAAARHCGIPAVAVCSLNWADILEHYCGGLAGADEIVGAIRSYYATAELFLRPQPSMPMDTLGNTVAIGPLVLVGESRRSELQQALQLPADRRLVVLTLGGIAGEVDITRWPAFDNTVFFVPDAWLIKASRLVATNRFRSIESTGLSYADLFASCDAMVTKPGYGAFAGAGCCGLPVLFTERGDWPEEPCLTAWLKQVGRAEAIGWQELAQGGFQPDLDALLEQSVPTSVPDASGALDGLDLIEALFR
ncbi:hypothetical protein ACUNV4_17455 [Granulosicoccus sp. 3-233]|uniref:hypothetical protein n=1 Tax=Granulosicoccus sp. 3-233 TaxID=3417969 RepID=UPI003D344AC3